MASTTTAQAQDGSAPAKPTGVAATATHDSVALAWDDPRDTSITHYQIFRRDRDVHDTGEFVTIKENTGSAAASYTDDTVQPDKNYVYRVKAVNRHGASTWSNFVRADTPAAPTPDPTPTPTPEPEPTPAPADLAPSGLEVSLVENRVTLTSDAPASDAASVTGYEVLRRRPREGEAALTTLVDDTGNAETGYTDDTANEPGVRYTYRVRALRDGEQSQVSNFARIDLPEDYAQDSSGSNGPTPTPEPEEEPSAEALAPSGLTAEAAEDGGVALSWTAPAEDASSVTGYEVMRAQAKAELTTLEADTGSTDTAYTDGTATAAGETHAYQVKALRGEEKSQGSSNLPDLFADLTSLEYLSLRNNSLTPRLPDDSFKNMTKLRELDLRGFSKETGGIPYNGYQSGGGRRYLGACWTNEQKARIHPKYPWNPREGSPGAFAPLTSLETYNYDADFNTDHISGYNYIPVPYAANNYTQPMLPPQNLQVSKSDVGYTLTWGAPPGASGITGYRVERRLNRDEGAPESYRVVGVGTYDSDAPCNDNNASFSRTNYNRAGAVLRRTTDSGQTSYTDKSPRLRGNPRVTQVVYYVFAISANGESMPARAACTKQNGKWSCTSPL